MKRNEEQVAAERDADRKEVNGVDGIAIFEYVLEELNATLEAELRQLELELLLLRLVMAVVAYLWWMGHA